MGKTMSQTQTQTQKTTKEELIVFFKTHNVQVIEEQDTIKVLGNVVYVSTDFVEVKICQSNVLTISNITYEEYSDVNRITIDNNMNIYEIRVSKSVKAYYKFPYLVIRVE